MDTSQPRRTAASRRSALPWPTLLWLHGQGSGVLAVGSCCWGPSMVHEGTPRGGGTLSPVSLSTTSLSLELVCALPDRRRARLSSPLLLGCSCSLPSAGSSLSVSVFLQPSPSPHVHFLSSFLLLWVGSLGVSSTLSQAPDSTSGPSLGPLSPFTVPEVELSIFRKTWGSRWGCSVPRVATSEASPLRIPGHTSRVAGAHWSCAASSCHFGQPHADRLPITDAGRAVLPGRSG